VKVPALCISPQSYAPSPVLLSKSQLVPIDVLRDARPVTHRSFTDPTSLKFLDLSDSTAPSNLQILVPLNLRPAHMPTDLICEDINVILGKLPCRDTSLEHEVQLGEGSAAWFGDAEVGVDDAEEADAAPEEAGVVAPV
jgi:hypothetical protein